MVDSRYYLCNEALSLVPFGKAIFLFEPTLDPPLFDIFLKNIRLFNSVVKLTYNASSEKEFYFPRREELLPC